MALRALIWDVDGTLAETERDGHRLAYNQAFEELGVPWHWDVPGYGALLKITGGKERMLHWWRGLDPRAAEQPEAQALIRQLYERKSAHYATLVRSGAVVLRPGVQRLLAEARQRGLVLAIATTTHEANVHELLRATLGNEASRWFAVLGAGDVVPCKKPAPDIYHWVLERLRLPASQCLALEDSAVGCAAARGAGLATVATRSLYTATEDLGEVLADLNGLGSHAEPAQGQLLGRPWQGLVDVDRLQEWQAAAQQHAQPAAAATPP